MKKPIILLLCLLLCFGCLGARAEDRDIADLRRAAEAGDAQAMDALGDRYRAGRGVEQNDALAAVWYYQAAEAGNPEAMFDVAVMFFYGYGTDQNIPAAREWLNRAAKANEPRALFYLGLCSRNGDQRLSIGKDTAKAQDYLIRAAVYQATPRNALFYYDWEIPDPACLDSVLAQANAGNAAAMCDAAYMYHYGVGVDKNDVLAAIWWYSAADAGVPLAMYDVAYMFIQGLGTDQNIGEGQRWIKKFIAAGKTGKAQEYARVYAAKVTAAPTPVPTSIPTAQPDVDNSWAWDTDPETMLRVLGVDVVMDAALAGDLDACYAMGWCCHYGIVVNQNDTEAFGWFLRVAQEGMPSAYVWVADAYFAGRGVAQDYAEAAEWYRDAADEGSAYAMHQLGLMYRDGLGVRQDERRAEKWLEMAEEAGFGQ